MPSSSCGYVFYISSTYVRRLWKNQIILFVFILTARPFLWNDVFFMCQWIRIKLVVSCMVQEKQVWKLFFWSTFVLFFSVRGNIGDICSFDNPDPDSDTEGSTRTMRLLKLHYHQQQVSSWSLFFAPYSRQTNKQTNKQTKSKNPSRIWLCCSTLTFQNVKIYILKCKYFFA